MIRHRLLAAMGSVRLQTKAWVNASSCVSGKFTRSLGGNCGMSAWNCRRWRTLSLGSQLSRAYATKKSCSGVPPCSPATRKSECCVLWMFSRSFSGVLQHRSVFGRAGVEARGGRGTLPVVGGRGLHMVVLALGLLCRVRPSSLARAKRSKFC